MFVHLHTHSEFSFLDGASKAKDLVAAAAAHGMEALALTEHNNVASAVRFQKQAGEAGIRAIIGAEVTVGPAPGHHLTLLARHARGYAHLCRILTRAHLSQPRGNPMVDEETLARYAEGLICLSGCRRGRIPTLLRQGRYTEAAETARRYREFFGPEGFYLEVQNHLLPDDRRLCDLLAQLGAHLKIPLVATNNVHYAAREWFQAQDLLTCMRHLISLEDPHPERKLNAEYSLKSDLQMCALFRDYPEALANTERIAAACTPPLDFGARHFPAFPVPEGETAFTMLRRLVYAGARRRYGKITAAIDHRLRHELEIIHRLGYDDYFLAVWDLVCFAKRAGIRCAGRGSAADSAVAYCLGITSVDSIGRNLMFERFLNPERANMPDIDVDFDARRREEVSRYVYRRYGDEHVAAVCTLNRYRARLAIREVGKAMGFPEEEIDRLAKIMPHISADDIRLALQHYPELRDSRVPAAKLEQLFDFCEQIADHPKFLGTHLGGLVIARDPILDLSPLQLAAKGIRIVQFDKDDVEELGLIKLDLLCLRTLGALEDAARDIRATQPRPLGRQESSEEASPDPLDTIPLDDPATYERLRAGETIGAFQLESPAQRALQTRLGANQIEDVVASVALIRPGPIKGNMVEPYIARRKGEEPVRYIHPKLEKILGKTYGVVLFQEQVIEIAVEIAGFTPGEADTLRRVMTKHRSMKEMQALERPFIEKCLSRGISRQVAETVFGYIVGYAGYGFCEAHAAAFGDTAYKTMYLLTHHPAEFYAALLSNQPMGFYSPNTLALEARRRGIRMLLPDVNKSEKRFTVEPGPAIRVGLKQVEGMAEAEIEALLAERQEKGSFPSLAEFQRRVPIRRNILERMILCGCFDSLAGNRKALMFELDGASSHSSQVSDYTDFEKFSHEARILGINVCCHLMAYYREELRRHRVLSTAEARAMATGAVINVAGLTIRPHRPPTRSGRTVVFFSLEDEHGMLDITTFEDVYQRYGKVIYTEPALIVKGRVERRGNAVSLTAFQIRDLPRAYRRDAPAPPERIIRDNTARGQSPGALLRRKR